MRALERPAARRLAVLAAVVLTASGFALRYLFQDFWHDEAYTLHFVGRGLGACLTDYHAANNHICFSVLLAGWMQVLEFLQAPTWALRVLPWCSAVLSVGALYAAVREGWGPRAAVWSALLWGTSHVFVNFACQLRGYSLSALLVALALWLAIRLHRRPSPPDLAGYAVVAFLAVGVLPTNLLLLGALSLWVVLSSGHQSAPGQPSSRLPAAVLLCSPALGAGWYLWHPTVRAQFFSHASGESASGSQALEVLQELGRGIGLDLWWLAPLLLAGLGLLGRARPAPDPDGPSETPGARGFLLGAWLPLAALALLPLRSRQFFPLLPWWFAGLGLGAARGVDWLSARWPKLRPVGTGLLPLLVLLAGLREATFPARYRARYAGQRPGDLYHQYYHVDFFPRRVITFLQEAHTRPPAAGFAGESDAIALNFYALLLDYPRLYMCFKPGAAEIFARQQAAGRTVYLVSRAAPRARNLLQTLTGRDPPREALALERDTGFFKIYRVTWP